MYTLYLHQVSKAGTRENVAYSLTDEQVEAATGNYLVSLARMMDDQMYRHCGWVAEDRSWEAIYYQPTPLTEEEVAAWL